MKKFSKKKYVALIVAGLALASVAAWRHFSQQATTSSIITADDGVSKEIGWDKLPKPLVAVLDRGDKVIKGLKSEAGLTAWVVSPALDPTEIQVFYTLDDGKYLLTGSLISETEKGIENLTTGLESRYEPKVDYTAVMEEIEKTGTWFAEGASDADAKFTLYGFFDPNCVFCHIAWLGLEPYLEQGLQVRWLPVAVIGDTSQARSAHLMQAADFHEAMRAGHTNWDQGKDAAFPKVESVPEDIAQKIQVNNALLRRSGAGGTPAFFYRDTEGQARLVSGVIPRGAIPSLTGLPYIVNENPKLRGF